MATHTAEQWGTRLSPPRILAQEGRSRGCPGPLRQIAVIGLGYEKPTLLHSNWTGGAASRLNDRYALRMLISDTLANAIDLIHMDAVSAAVPLKTMWIFNRRS